MIDRPTLDRQSKFHWSFFSPPISGPPASQHVSTFHPFLGSNLWWEGHKRQRVDSQGIDGHTPNICSYIRNTYRHEQRTDGAEEVLNWVPYQRILKAVKSAHRFCILTYNHHVNDIDSPPKLYACYTRTTPNNTRHPLATGDDHSEGKSLNDVYDEMTQKRLQDDTHVLGPGYSASHQTEAMSEPLSKSFNNLKVAALPTKIQIKLPEPSPDNRVLFYGYDVGTDWYIAVQQHAQKGAKGF